VRGGDKAANPGLRDRPQGEVVAFYDKSHLSMSIWRLAKAA